MLPRGEIIHSIFVQQTLQRSTRCFTFCSIRNADTKHRRQYKAGEEDPTYGHMVIVDTGLEVSLYKESVPLCEELQ